MKTFTIKDMIKYAKTLQKSLCAYGTTEGDGRKCDCKFSKTGELGHKFSESGCGCAEARAIIYGLEKLEKDLSM
jgi:hypothetical protein